MKLQNYHSQPDMVVESVLISLSLGHNCHHFLMVFPWKSIYIRQGRRKMFYIIPTVGQATSEDAKKVLILQKQFLAQEYVKLW